MTENEKRVLPGEALAIVEEFDPGPGTYVDESGYVRAAIPGIAVFDVNLKIVRIKPLRSPRLPRVGAEVVATVTSVRHDVVFVDILGEVSLRGVPRFLYEYSSIFPGAISIANISDEYVKDINDYYRPSDVILAKVVSNTAPYHLSTKEPIYGVVYARCARCGHLLEPLNNRAMKCPRCGHVEKRKVSSLAGSKLLRINIKHFLVRTRS
ncbi:MAG: exosome complex RNA-binding protein Csl4 [Desulfurococcales archaeon]|nr:exosome complex RNA-binding protein Csl4 [Desulfurococcales archaeon]